MGANYSSGFTPLELQEYLTMSVVEIRSVLHKLRQMRQGEEESGPTVEGMYFIKRDEFMRVFQVYGGVGLKHFGYFDPGSRGRVPTMELLGSLAMCCGDREEPKVKFVFDLCDRDKDGYLNKAELTLLMHSVARGVARIKHVSAPSLETVGEAAERAFRLCANKKQGVMNLAGLLDFLKEDVGLRKYMSSLARMASADAEDLYKQQGKLLAELADVDSRLDEIDTKRRRFHADSTAYREERGGDAGLLVPMPDVFFDQDSEEDDHWASSCAKARRYGSKLVDTKRKRSSRGSFIANDLAFFETGLNSQLERRHRRAKLKKGATTRDVDSDVFQRCARNRVVGLKKSASATADAEVISRAWMSLENLDQEQRARLDLDTFQDLFDGLAVLIPDKEATQALGEIPHTRRGEYALADVLEWWRVRFTREHSSESAAELALRDQSDLVDRFKFFVADAFDRLKGHVSTRLFNAGERRRSRPGGERESDCADDEPTVRNWSVRVGNTPTEYPTTLKVQVKATPEYEKKRQELEMELERFSPKIQITKMLSRLEKHDVAAWELLLLEDKRGTSSSEELSPEDNEDVDSRAESESNSDDRMEWVTWMDVPCRPEASLEAVTRVARHVEAAANCCPRDYAKPFFDRVRCDVLKLKIKGASLSSSSSRGRKPTVGRRSEQPKSDDHLQQSRLCLRVQAYRARDPIAETESDLSEDARPSKVLGKLSAVLSLGTSLSDLMRLSRVHFDSSEALFGPNVDELDAEPRAFSRWLSREKRRMVEKIQGVLDLSPPQVRDALQSLGISSAGASSRSPSDGLAARTRLSAAYRRQASKIGFGEVSAFGQDVVHRMFKKFDTSNDGVLDFGEFVRLTRAFRSSPPGDPKEFLREAADAKVLVRDGLKRGRSVQGVSERGFLAHYEHRPGLASDAARLGVGSLDDLLDSCLFSLSTEFDADVATKLENVVESVFCAKNSTAQHESGFGGVLRRFLSAMSSPEARSSLVLFALRFVKGVFTDCECESLKDLFPPKEAPAWLVTPGWLYSSVLTFRSLLADGKDGIIPAIRAALSEYFGPGLWDHPSLRVNADDAPEPDDLWTDPWRRADGSSTGQPESDPPAEKPTDSELVEFLFRDIVTPNRERRRAVSGDTIEEEEAAEAEAWAATPGSSAARMSRMSLSRLAELRDDLTAIEIELSKKVVARGVRARLERRRAARTREVTAIEETLRRCSRLSLARGLAAYDGARTLLMGPRCFGAGGRWTTSKMETEGGLEAVYLNRILPAGKLEANDAKRARSAKESLSKRLVETAKREIQTELRRLEEDAAKKRADAQKAALRKYELDLLEEVRLYERGRRRARRASVLLKRNGAADPKAQRQRLQAEESWRALAQLQEARRGPGSASLAVALNNVACLEFEKGILTRSDAQLAEAAETCTRANSTMALALEDALRADAVAHSARLDLYEKARRDRDRSNATKVAALTSEFLKTLSRERELLDQLGDLQSLTQEEDDDLEDIQSNQSALLRRINDVARDRHALQASSSALLDPPTPPDIDLSRHDESILTASVLLSNELLIRERTAQSPENAENANQLYSKMIALYALLSPAARIQASALNAAFASCHYHDERVDEDGDHPSDGSSDDDDDRADPNARTDQAPLRVLGVGVELAGFYPTSSPAEKLALERAKLEATKAADARAEKDRERAEEAQRQEERKLKNLRKHLALVTEFNSETFKLLELVNPARAKRIKARDQRRQRADAGNNKKRQAVLQTPVTDRPPVSTTAPTGARKVDFLASSLGASSAGGGRRLGQAKPVPETE